MSQTITKYTFKDKEDGDITRVEYVHNPCCCNMNCNDDELRIYEDDDSAPYTMQIQGGECKLFIMAILDGEYEKID